MTQAESEFQRAMDRAAYCGITLAIRPTEDIRALENYALERAGGDDVQAQFSLRYALYDQCGSSLWGENLHVGEAEYTDFEDICESIEHAPKRGDPNLIGDIQNDALGKMEFTPWDAGLYLAAAMEFTGIGPDGVRPLYGADKEKHFTAWKQNYWEFYQATAERSIWEWDTDLIVVRAVQLLEYYLMDASLEDQRQSVFQDAFVRLSFGLHLKEVVQILRFEKGSRWFEYLVLPRWDEAPTPELIDELLSWAEPSWEN